MPGSGPQEPAHDLHGSPRGPALVLLHAFPLHRGMWADAAVLLAAGGAFAVVPDLRGHGGSPPRGPKASMADLAADVLALLDRLGVERFVPVGCSMGGYVALQLLADAPGRVAGLVLADSRADADDDAARQARSRLAEAVQQHGMAALEEALLPRLLCAETVRGRPDRVRRVSAMILGNPPEGALAALTAMAGRPDRTDLLAQARVPCLLVVGAEDAITPPALARALAGTVPGARLVEVPGAGHLAPLEAPETFVAAVLDAFPFVRRDGADPAP